jgi:hypothetical protein
MWFHAPLASITLIKDYFGDQKMVLVLMDQKLEYIRSSLPKKYIIRETNGIKKMTINSH